MSAMSTQNRNKKPHATDFFESLTIPAVAGGTSDEGNNHDEAQEYNSDFLAPKFFIPHEKGPDRWSCKYNKNEITSTKYGTIISIGKRSTLKPFSCGELISRQPNIGYGTYSVDMISTNIPGHVTALFIIANGISELDVELTGLDSTAVWINIWEGSKQHPIKVPLGFDASKDWHNYAIEWRKDFVAWYIDGKLIHKRSDVPTADPTTTQYKLALNSWTHDKDDQWAGKFRYPPDGRVPKSYFRDLSYRSD
ncbi:hypothetical protein BGZ51_006553 [Haplosporangium sp. Z 767]|nr:hypothetical protein BGZ50_006667 [Haplosporangium sp. Z 11]KAF9179920.1 hypothetical protein BGZ51_006553 [Haplosporangium sp. Z 767]